METERGRKLRLIAMTALISVVLTTIACWSLMKWSLQPPPVPIIAPPKSIKVTLYPFDQYVFGGMAEREIPVEEFEAVMRLIRPERPYDNVLYEGAMPLLGVVFITHENGKRSTVHVREFGHNPALVSIDGRHYYFAERHDDAPDGGMKLIQVLNRIAEGKKKPQ